MSGDGAGGAEGKGDEVVDVARAVQAEAVVAGGGFAGVETVLLTAGIRVGSAVALDVEDVDLERCELRLRSAKGDQPEVVFMPAATRGERAPSFGRYARVIASRCARARELPIS